MTTHTPGLTKPQHFVALLIMLPSVPFSLPLGLLVILTGWLYRFSQHLYDWVGYPFLAVRRCWLIRCERVNSAKAEAQS